MEKPGQVVETGKAGETVQGQEKETGLGVSTGEVDEAKAKLSGMDSAEAEIKKRLEEEKKPEPESDGKPPEPKPEPTPEEALDGKKKKAQEVAKKGAEATPEEREAVADYILDRFKDKGDPGREVAKSYFYAEKVITKQGQKLAEARDKINALTKIIEDLKSRGEDTGKASAELEGSLEDYADLVAETETGEPTNPPQDTRSETERLIDSQLDKKLAPVFRAQVIQENLRRDAQVVETLREKYPDFADLEPKVADIIRAKRVDILNPNKIEIAYLMAKGLKAHEDAIAQATKPTPDASRKADKDKAKAQARVETAGNPEPGETEDYSKKLERAKKSGDSDAWVDVIASKLNI